MSESSSLSTQDSISVPASLSTQATLREYVNNPEAIKTNRNLPLLEAFLGPQARYQETVFLPAYYGGLLSWALLQYLEQEKWQVVNMAGYQYGEPKFVTIGLGDGKEANIPVNALLLVKRARVRMAFILEISLGIIQALEVTGHANYRQLIESFLAGLLDWAKEHNFYRGQKLEFGYPARFLNLQANSWEKVILEAEVKREIQANTTDFLRNQELWTRFGIPTKRGVLLSGVPGSGKTLICRALMAESKGMTCITARADLLEMGTSILDLYAMAQDLKPSLIVIEDIDIIGKKRDEFGFRETALVSLLSAMDGLEEKEDIVTVATTNYLELLDKALKERPARFDRVIHLGLPELEQRQELIQRLSRKIPLDVDTQSYIAGRTAGFTPAQLQEVLFSLVIEQAEPIIEKNTANMTFSPERIDNVILRISGVRKKPLGFLHSNGIACGEVN